MHDVSSALETVGLDPAVGFLHRDRPGRPSLALDMMEEFRPFMADRMALSLINLSQVQKKGFDETESGAVLMDDETRKTLLVAYQKRKQDEIVHPFLNEKGHNRVAVSYPSLIAGPLSERRPGWISAIYLEIGEKGLCLFLSVMMLPQVKTAGSAVCAEWQRRVLIMGNGFNTLFLNVLLTLHNGLF